MKHLLCTLALGLALVGCGGGSDEPAKVVASNATLPVNATTVSALASETFTFANGVPEFGTTVPTTLTFTDASGTPGFKVTAADGEMTGTTTFGSCHFKITAVTPGSVFTTVPIGTIVTIDPCEAELALKGVPADNSAQPIKVQLKLGISKSAVLKISLMVNGVGALFDKDGKLLGDLTVIPVTGAGG